MNLRKMGQAGAMRRLTLLLCALLVSATLSFGAPQNSPLTLDDVLKQMDGQSADFRSLRADMERTNVTVVVNDISTESGKIWVRRDDKMRIDFSQPDARTILRDRDQIYIYTPKTNQVEEYNLGKQKALVDQFTLLGFGTSGKALKSGFDVMLVGEETLGDQKVVHLVLTPKSDDVRKHFSKIELWINESNWLPVQQKFYQTGSGDYSTVVYKNLQPNVKIDDAEFKPHWPHGATYVKVQQ